ncbi:MAG: ABC transporter ATP-binding protein [Bacteroidetes bacterium]|nr:MAG: ABC transporter ATP-binding protein [Bacteroidota bacterium]
MKNFFELLKYGKAYKRFAYLNIFFNLLGIVFGLFSLASVMPFLDIIFKPETTALIEPQAGSDFGSVKATLMYEIARIVQGNPKEALIYICVVIVVFTILKNVCVYLALVNLISFRQNTVRDLRDRLYKKVLRLPLSHFSDERKGDLISRMSGDVTVIEANLNASLDAVFKQPFNILVSLIMLIYISPMLTLIVFIMLPLAALLIVKIGKAVKAQTTRQQNKLGELISNFEETLGGMRIIKAFTREPFFLRRFLKQSQLLNRISIGIARRSDIASPLTETMGITIAAIILFIGGSFVLNKDMGLDGSAFIFYIVLFGMLIAPSKSFSSAFYSIQKGLAAKGRLEEIFTLDEKITEKKDAKTVGGFNTSIIYNNVSFAYDKEPVLSDISLEIKKGEMIALVGPSGGGKSTLADLLPRFYDVTNGSITIDGTDIRDYKIASLRGSMGVVTQESILFNDTVYNNIAFGNYDVTAEDIENAARVANAHEFIVDLERGYQTNIGERGSKLSGGQRQRIAIARAVLKNPDILILDEATSALDTTSEKLVQEALNNLMKNRTSVVIAHRLSTIQTADKIVVIQKGRIVQTGTHNELLNREGLYRELYELQKLGVN